MRNQLKIGTVLSYISLILNCAISILLTPFIIHQIGDSQYGVYRIIGSMVSYLTVMKLGLGNASVRYLSEYRIKKNIAKETELLNVIKAANYFSILCVCLISTVLWKFIPNIFSGSLTNHEITTAQKVFLILIISIIVSIINDIYDAVLNAYEEFIFVKAADVLRNFVRGFLIFALLFFSRTAMILTFIDLFSNLLLLAANVYKCMSIGTKPKLNWQMLKQTKWTEYKEILIFALYVLINTIIHQLIWNTDIILIGMRLDSTSASIYGVGSTISSVFFSASSVVSSMLLPRTVRMVEEGASKLNLSKFMIRVAKYQSYIIFYLLVAYLILGKQFITLWMGPGYSDAWKSSLFVMLGTVFASIVVSVHSILKALNRQGFFMVVYSIIFFLNMILTYVTLPYYGIVGAGFWTGITFAVINVFVLWPYYQKVIGLDILGMIKYCMPIFLVSIFIGIGGVIFLSRIVVVDTWPRFVAAAVVYTMIYFIIVLVVCLDDEDKQLLKNIRKGRTK